MHRQAAPILAVVLATMMPVSRVTAQAPTPGEQVRVTTQRQGAAQRTTGWLLSVDRDTVALRTSYRDVLRVPRADVIRLERRRNDVSIARTAGIGCLVGGAVLGGIGIASRDADSPGAEETLAVVGMVGGCVIGGAAGLFMGAVSRGPWEEVALGGS